MVTVYEEDPKTRASLSFPTASITRQGAERLLVATRGAGERLGFQPAIAIVDPGGHLVAFERGDRTPFLAGLIAMDKAWTAISYRVSSAYWNDYVRNPSVSSLQNTPRVMPVGGGYAFRDGDFVIGAVGVSGGTLAQDEEAALTALAELDLAPTDAIRSA